MIEPEKETIRHEYTNDETWHVVVGIGQMTRNYQDSPTNWLKMAKDCDCNAEWFAKEMKREIESNVPEMLSIYDGLLAESLARVNWYEVADIFIKRNARFLSDAQDLDDAQDSDDILDSDILQ